MRRICSLQKDFTETTKVYQEHLIRYGHDFKHVTGMTCQEVRERKTKRDRRVMFSVEYNPGCQIYGKLLRNMVLFWMGMRMLGRF